MKTARDPIEIPQDGYDLVRWSLDVDGQPLGFTDARIAIREQAHRDAPLLGEVSVATGHITISNSGTATVIEVDFSEVFVATLPPGVWFYDLRVEDALGRPLYPLNGPFTVPDTLTGPTPQEVTP